MSQRIFIILTTKLPSRSLDHSMDPCQIACSHLYQHKYKYHLRTLEVHWWIYINISSVIHCYK